MTAAPIDFNLDMDALPVIEVAAASAARRSDGMVRVQMVPLVRDGDHLPDEPATGPSGSLVSQQLIVGYIASLAQRAVKAVRNKSVQQVGDDHIHPEHVACLRCAVVGSTHMRTLAIALLGILAKNNTDEEWNGFPNVSDTQVISRLRRLAISDADLEDLYGEHWAHVIVAGLRVEASDLEMVDCLTRDHDDTLWISDYIDDPVDTRRVLAAYHLGWIVCPRESSRAGVAVGLKRARIARRFAVAMAKVAAGQTPPWMDYLPAPPL